MKVQCGHCPAKYAVVDERIQDKKVRIHCKRCGASIVVDGKVDPPLVTSTPARKSQRPPSMASDLPPPPESEPESRPSPRPVAHTMMGGLEAPAAERLRARSSPPPRPMRSPASPPARADEEPRPALPANHRALMDPPPGADQNRWRVALTKQDLRWMTTSEIVEAYQSGAVKLETFVFRAGMPTWVTLLEVPEISEALSEAGGMDASASIGAVPPVQPAPPAPPAPPSPPAAPTPPAPVAAQPIAPPAAPRKPPPRALAVGSSFGDVHDPSEPLPFALVSERSNGVSPPAAPSPEEPSDPPPFMRPAIEPPPPERVSHPAVAAAPLPPFDHAPAPAPFAAAHAASGSTRWIWVAVVLVLLGAVVALIGPRYGLKLL
jgi:predicted Zn finger-like uncharacterized protein